MKCSQNYDFIFCLIMYMGWQFRLSLVSEAIVGKFNRRRWGCTMSRMMMWAFEIPPGPHPLEDMKCSLTFASPIINRYPLMLQVGRPLPQLTPGFHLCSWVDRTHTHSQIHILTHTRARMRTHTHTHTHAHTHTNTTHTTNKQTHHLRIMEATCNPLKLMCDISSPTCSLKCYLFYTCKKIISYY